MFLGTAAKSMLAIFHDFIHTTVLLFSHLLFQSWWNVF